MKKFKILAIILAISLVLSFGVYACHGGNIFYFTGPLSSTSTYDGTATTLDIDLPGNREIWVVAPITTYNSTDTNYTHVEPWEDVAERYENITINSVVIYNAVYSFENITNGERLDNDGNGKIDIYNKDLKKDLMDYNYFLVVPIYNMGNITDETQYLSDAIVYALDEPYCCSG